MKYKTLLITSLFLISFSCKKSFYEKQRDLLFDLDFNQAAFIEKENVIIETNMLYLRLFNDSGSRFASSNAVIDLSSFATKVKRFQLN